MKKVIKLFSTISLVIIVGFLNAQNKKQTLTVLPIDAHYRAQGITPKNMGDLIRREVEKLDTFEVTDIYDIDYLLKKNKIEPDSCYGKTCLSELGKLINSDKMLTGTIEMYEKNIIFTLRLIDVKSTSIQKATTIKFINNSYEILTMTEVIVRQMFNKPNDQELIKKLTVKNDFDSEINNPYKDRLRLDGPRMGLVSFTGDLYNRIQEDKNSGGFGAFPVMFQFGYQFEKQYLNEGKVQALFEFIPMITGLDQGYFIPSVAILHGVRSNVNGWEFAFGPTFSLNQESQGYYDTNNNWQLESYWKKDSANINKPNPYKIIRRLDSRGEYTFNSAFVIAFGRTFKSGKLNIPVNGFVIPGRNGWRFGVSFGFNAKNK